MALKYKQGQFVPSNKDKYNNLNGWPVFRSSWEHRFMIWCDQNPQVIKWSSESTIIPYFSPVDNKYHRYFVDFSLTIQTTDGIQDFLVEIKPEAQSVPPVRGRKREKTYINEVLTYETNQAKWKQARIFCEKAGMKFVVMGLDEKKNWKILG